MSKKWIILSALGLAILVILYFARIAMVTSQHQKSLQDLEQRISEVQKENNELKEKIADSIKDDETENVVEDEGKVVVSNIEIQSNNMYTEGDLKGYIYGNFKVIAKVKNLTNSNYDSLKIASVFMTSIPHYEKNIKSESKAKTLLNLKSGEEREVVFENFQVDHPETIQEIIVSVMDYRNNVSDVQKVKIKAAFSPESQD